MVDEAIDDAITMDEAVNAIYKAADNPLVKDIGEYTSGISIASNIVTAADENKSTSERLWSGFKAVSTIVVMVTCPESALVFWCAELLVADMTRAYINP